MIADDSQDNSMAFGIAYHYCQGQRHEAGDYEFDSLAFARDFCRAAYFTKAEDLFEYLRGYYDRYMATYSAFQLIVAAPEVA